MTKPGEAVTQVTMENVLELLERAVRERGEDYVDPNAGAESSCAYWDWSTDKPSCIAGLVLSYVGATGRELRHIEGSTVPDPTGLAGGALGRYIAPDRRISMVLRAAQWAQDAGRTYGRVLEIARREYDRVTREDEPEEEPLSEE